MNDTAELPENPQGDVRRRVSNQLGRASTSRAGMWFWEVDRVLMVLVFLLIAIGLVAVAAASPATARRYSDATHIMPSMHYFWRQLMWVCMSVPVLIGVSMLPITLARRLALVGAAVFLAMLVVVRGDGSISASPISSHPNSSNRCSSSPPHGYCRSAPRIRNCR
jgi:cell division protein FtsW